MRNCINCGLPIEKWNCLNCSWIPERINDIPLLAPSLAEASDGFKASYFKNLVVLEDNHFWFKARNKLIVENLKKYFPNMQRYLEIGCGTGYVLREVASQFPKTEITGSEIFCKGLEFTSGRVPRAELVQMDARVIPYTEHFDVVGAFDVLEHISEDRNVLKEIYKSLRQGGGMILTVPQHQWLWSAQDEAACHVRRYIAKELLEKIADAGFKSLWTTSFVSLLLPVMFASRLSSKLVKDRDAMTELRIGRLANSVFSSIMTIERRLIKLGIHFPVGGSLLLVAIKV